MVHQMQHHVMGQRTIPRLRTPLCIDTILRGRDLMQQVERFNPCNEFALTERLAERGIQHKIIRVQFRTAIPPATVASADKVVLIRGRV